MCLILIRPTRICSPFANNTDVPAIWWRRNYSHPERPKRVCLQKVPGTMRESVRLSRLWAVQRMHHHGQRHRAGSQLVRVLATFLSSHIYAQAPNVQGFELFKACTSMVNAIVLGLNWCVSWRLSFLLTFMHKLLMYKALSCSTHAPAWLTPSCWVSTGACLGDFPFFSHLSTRS